MTTITITAFETSPDRGRGLARDMRVRWALEELGLPYAVRLLSFEALKQPAHRTLNPFGQIPSFEQDGIALFESGAIVLHLARTHPGLLPADPAAQARATAWLFAALSTVEPPIVERSMAALFESAKPWHEERLAMLDGRVRVRLDELSAHLGQREALDGGEWLDGAFSAGDLMMVTVLRRLESSGILADYPGLAAYIARAQARPAYARAFADQLAVFERSQAANS
ncbi:glutathione S-transferase family protein [Novosphingobium resinovorum]|uniref:glutathione S-transferase family protein n=1 Tax=Novosphingobium resinovorum TaxID=158500 RepID=UPI002ED19B9A|nr:glutathione S-transferase family protein [Novosphingobium resinovorum]